MERLVMGILAHVDAGKTTLSEAILYGSGSIRKMGRVDKGDAFLDTYEMEKSRGITIFSKQALFPLQNRMVTLLDTPGHVDFSAEMERTLQVLDCAILVISGADGVQGHTRTLWRLLGDYRIPVFLFINKMDQLGTDRQTLMKELKAVLGEGCVDLGCLVEESQEKQRTACYEEIAINEEAALDEYLETGSLTRESICRMVEERRIFPCFFGSALKNQGVRELLEGLYQFLRVPAYSQEFGARVFKISRDGQGNRLAFLKVTGGRLKARMLLEGRGDGTAWEEKVNQIRIYSGDRFQTVEEAEAGSICAVTGLNQVRPGEGLGIEAGGWLPVLEPVLTCRMELPEGVDAAGFLPKLRQLEEEEPQLHIIWDEALQELQVRIMGEVQTEVVKGMILERFGVKVDFGRGNIVYKETVADRVEGVGHFEPLRHYAEVHLLIEPGEPGSGLVFGTACSEDMLDRNWQRLVLTHLEEREHRGILTGSALTDTRITLVAGRAHQKHTEGGDFRQATYRALRQGLMEVGTILLEPCYDFRLELPEKMVGRAMADLEKMAGRFALQQEGEQAVLTGTVPVASLGDYQKEVASYTRGHGRLFCTLKGYEPCHNTEEIVERIGYQPDRDTEHPSSSVFCSHGAGVIVPWNEVKAQMHVESVLREPPEALRESEIKALSADSRRREETVWMGTEEVDAILARTFHANRKEKGRGNGSLVRKAVNSQTFGREAAQTYIGKKAEPKESYLLVDGYNIIFAWEDLRQLAEENIDGARGRLMDMLCNYQGLKGCYLILVFDAYRVQRHKTEILDYHNIHVVYTREAETADQFIEKFAYKKGKTDHVTVATSDYMEQIITRGQGCYLLSARELKEEMERVEAAAREDYGKRQQAEKNYLTDMLSEEGRSRMEEIKEKE